MSNTFDNKSASVKKQCVKGQDDLQQLYDFLYQQIINKQKQPLSTTCPPSAHQQHQFSPFRPPPIASDFPPPHQNHNENYLDYGNDGADYACYQGQERDMGNHGFTYDENQDRNQEVYSHESFQGQIINKDSYNNAYSQSYVSAKLTQSQKLQRFYPLNPLRRVNNSLLSLTQSDDDRKSRVMSQQKQKRKKKNPKKDSKIMEVEGRQESLSSQSSYASSISSFKSGRSQKDTKSKKGGYNGDNEPIFVNPFACIPEQTINFDKFSRLCTISFQQFSRNITQIYKKMIVYGQKQFFKNKQNQQLVNHLLSLTGLKKSEKLGKQKTFREIKAIYQYITGTDQQDQTGMARLDRAYIEQFKKILNPEKSSANFDSILQRGSLHDFGFESKKKTQQQDLEE